MKKKVKLNKDDIQRIVKKTINEQYSDDDLRDFENALYERAMNVLKRIEEKASDELSELEDIAHEAYDKSEELSPDAYHHSLTSFYEPLYYFLYMFDGDW